MKLSNEYKTKQKENLIAFLIKNKDRHTNVQEISSYLAQEGSPVGTATIYRQLEKLVERGIVRKYVLDGKTGACFQYIGDNSCHEHFHLKCVCCGQLIHIDCDFLSGVNKHIFEHHGFTVNSTQTVFYGKCSECSGSEEE
ncbi:MAG: transcriptional repressor [Ruminococcus sp.]|nr:transcriptional repressor [Ruminococcus sp.]MBQ9957038.1 transcriptional repressor [Ruminococcus sp.]MBR6791699.1 transcriptional repressor [Ruminococcus sp.]